MTEMTPEMEDLRQVAGYLVDIEEGAYARRVDKALRAWEADLARIEALEKEINVGEAEGDIGAHRLVELRAILAAEEKT